MATKRADPPLRLGRADKKTDDDGAVEGEFLAHDEDEDTEDTEDSKGPKKKLSKKEREKKAKEKKQAEDEALAIYGWQRAVINSSPELKKIFDKAVKEGWSPARFVSQAQNTKWFKQHSAAWRTNEALRLADPGEWRAQKIQLVANLEDMAARMGAQLSPKQVNSIAEQSLSMGWDESQMRNSLEQYIVERAGPGELGGQYVGEAGQIQMALQKFAQRNAYKIPEGSLGKWIKSVSTGEATVEDYEMFIRRQTAASYGAYADEIMAGADLYEIASPFLNTYQRVLEVADVDIDDPLIQKALNFQPGKDGKMSAMPLWQFEQELKKDQRWQMTENAKNEAKNRGSRIMSLLGL